MFPDRHHSQQRAWASGISDTPLLLEQTSRDHGVVVELTPQGAYSLFEMPLQYLTNAKVDLTDLLGTRAWRLGEQLGECANWEDRFRLLDDQLTAWMRDSRELAPEVYRAWQQLVTSSGRAKASALAQELGWSRQHLNARFHQQVGLAPKSVARIARFYHAIQLATVPAAPLWSDVAAACGYTDQSHLNLDFRALTGSTPTELLAPGSRFDDVFMGAHLSLKHQTTSARRVLSASHGSSPAAR
jgi:AraC-like DNA-binding protein